MSSYVLIWSAPDVNIYIVCFSFSTPQHFFIKQYICKYSDFYMGSVCGGERECFEKAATSRVGRKFQSHLLCQFDQFEYCKETGGGPVFTFTEAILAFLYLQDGVVLRNMHSELMVCFPKARYYIGGPI